MKSVRSLSWLLVVVLAAGCGSTEPKEDPTPRRLAQDSPEASSEEPDFADPRPPVPVSAKIPRDVEPLRDQLLHDEKR